MRNKRGNGLRCGDEKRGARWATGQWHRMQPCLPCSAVLSSHPPRTQRTIMSDSTTTSEMNRSRMKNQT